jgi:DHA1 family bicyclomycin/chloramphenicol resistance-like MFS transporter
MSHSLSERQLILILASLSAISPLSIDMYLPAFPSIASDLHTSIPNVEFSLSLFFFGIAMGQLFGGPISDAYGRKPLISIGLILFGLSSFALIFTHDITLFWILRAIQSFGGGIATVNVSATVRDRYEGKESARVFSLIAMIMLTAPLIAPTLGALFLKLFSWRSIFVFLCVYAFMILTIYFFFFPKGMQTSTKITPFQNYKRVLSHKTAMVLIVSQILCSSGMYTFITSSSFIYMEHFHIGATLFSFFFASNVILLMLTGRLNAHLVKRIEPFYLLRFGMVLQAFLGFLLFILRDQSITFIFPLIMLYIGSLGFIFSNSVSLTLEFFPNISASANAIIGVLQYSMGALMGFVASFLHDGTLLPVMGVMMGVSLCSVTLFLVGVRNDAFHHHATPAS